MDKILIDSDAISSITYDENENILEIEFPKGEIYHYLNVPINVYEDLLISESKGKYFHGHIKNSYMYKRIE